MTNYYTALGGQTNYKEAAPKSGMVCFTTNSDVLKPSIYLEYKLSCQSKSMISSMQH